MPYLRNFMGCSNMEVCGNEEELDRYINEIISNPHRDEYFGLKKEIKEILDDPNFDYMNLLENDEYEIGLYGVEFPSNQFEAKKFIIDYFWNKLYREDRMDI